MIGPNEWVIMKAAVSLSYFSIQSGFCRCLPALFVGPHLIPVTAGYVQHAKAFAMVLSEMFVVHFMRPSNGTHISIVAAGKPFESLVNDDIVYQKIGEAVQGYAKANGRHPIDALLQTQHDAKPTGNGKNEEEGVVFFEGMALRIVVVFVQVPQKTVHHVFVRSPGNGFHENECAAGDGYPKNPMHEVRSFMKMLSGDGPAQGQAHQQEKAGLNQ
jgi:hypothetical protein